MKISNLPEKKLKVIVMKMLTRLQRRVNELNGDKKGDRKDKKEPSQSSRMQ